MSPEAPPVRQTEPDSSRSHRRRFSRLGLGLAACAAVQCVLWLGISVGLDALNAWEILQADLVINAVSFQVVYYILTALMGLRFQGCRAWSRLMCRIGRCFPISHKCGGGRG